ncbi:MAG: hypothetical protein KKD44_23015 [Proteobacteria bacterium]|nr:hypothetical protein [Pseudomonadota bacterium]
MTLKTCVNASGRFVYGVNTPFFHIANFRKNNRMCVLGKDAEGNMAMNTRNFPEKSVDEPMADVIYEIHNPFPFRGATFINSAWAKGKSKDPLSINLPSPTPMSFTQKMKQSLGDSIPMDQIFSNLPQQILLTIASESTDTEELVRIAHLCCTFQYTNDNIDGIRFEKNKHGDLQPEIQNHVLFEALVNNPCLPDIFKEVMVLRPGIQGGSEIMGEYLDASCITHVYEYLRRNSYIPWGHFASNMAEDAIRYDMAQVSEEDIKGLRFLYYQRTVSRIGDMLGLGSLTEKRTATEIELEALRCRIMEKIRSEKSGNLFFNATLWGWNYGFTFTAGGYNLHGSHQQIHQQYALLPKQVSGFSGYDQGAANLSTYGCGDQVYAFIKAYRQETGQDFFADYMTAIQNNTRMDSTDQTLSSLVVYEDDHVMLFVPKAQTSQWELNLMPKKPLAHILATDTEVRHAVDKAMFKAMKTLTALGARMVTCIEYSGRFDVTDEKQHLLYAFLPKIPYSMGAFTEAQLRFINGHYPEDFAYACRQVCPK